MDEGWGSNEAPKKGQDAQFREELTRPRRTPSWGGTRNALGRSPRTVVKGAAHTPTQAAAGRQARPLSQNWSRASPDSERTQTPPHDKSFRVTAQGAWVQGETVWNHFRERSQWDRLLRTLVNHLLTA